MGDEERNAVAFDAVGIARTLLRTIRSGALATLDAATGAPFASLVTVATDVDGSPLLLLSRLSAHTTNLEADPRASLLLAATGKGDPLAHPRLTVTGTVADDPDARVRRRFLARHPKAELYADFPDFGFRRLAVASAHLNGGFARAAGLSAAELLTRIEGAEAMADAEERALTHMNEDHAGSIRHYATALAGAPDGEWRITGLDPEGADLAAGDLTARVLFRTRATDRAGLRAALVALAGETGGPD